MWKTAEFFLSEDGGMLQSVVSCGARAVLTWLKKEAEKG